MSNFTQGLDQHAFVPAAPFWDAHCLNLVHIPFLSKDTETVCVMNWDYMAVICKRFLGKPGVAC